MLEPDGDAVTFDSNFFEMWWWFSLLPLHVRDLCMFSKAQLAVLH